MSKWKPIYRKLFHRKGHGVHSPFVFNLITNVIEQRIPFYAYKEIEQVRLHLEQHDHTINYHGEKSSVKEYLRKQSISKKEGELLFRLANHYKPSHILAVGSSMGLTPLYLTAYSANTHCITIEHEKEIAEIASENIEKKAKASVLILQGDYAVSLQKALLSLPKIDCIYLSKELPVQELSEIIKICWPAIHDESMIFISGIHTSAEKKNFWTTLCQDPKITVSVDLYKLGLIFFRPKLHKRMYKTSF